MSVKTLVEERQEAREKEERVGRLIRAERKDLEGAREIIEAEREQIGRFRDRRTELGKELEAEIAGERDKRGDAWEQWAEDRRDELADLVEASEARIDRVLLNIHESADLLAELRRKDRKLDNRIAKLTERIKRQREDRKGRLSPHFHVVEFGCRDGTPVPKASIPALRVACREYLEPLREERGPVHINSGFRTRTYNASIGGASMSVHVYDAPWQHDPWAVAIDHTCAGLPASAVYAFHETFTHPDGMGRYAAFTHVDNRNRIGWADSRWVGP